VQDRGDQPLDVAVVEAGCCVAEVDRDAIGEAGRQQQDAPFPSLSELAIRVADLRRCGFCCVLVMSGG
jgi:hypothetical protein